MDNETCAGCGRYIENCICESYCPDCNRLDSRCICDDLEDTDDDEDL